MRWGGRATGRKIVRIIAFCFGARLSKWPGMHTHQSLILLLATNACPTSSRWLCSPSIAANTTAICTWRKVCGHGVCIYLIYPSVFAELEATFRGIAVRVCV